MTIEEIAQRRTGHNRRAEPRFAPRAGVAASGRTEASRASEPLDLIDVSSRGARFHLGDRPGAGSVLYLAIRLPSEPGEVGRTGLVVWSQADTAGPCRIGVTFDRPLSAGELASLAVVGPESDPPAAGGLC